VIESRDTLLSVWREACRHIEIAESAANIADLLVPNLPIDQLIVQRIDAERSVIETLAVGPAGRGVGHVPRRIECTATQLKRMSAWSRRGEIVLQRTGGPRVRDIAFAGALPLDRDVLIGPLCSEHDTCGALLLATRPGQRFNQLHQKIMRQLCEPFSAALENDHRLRELTALREAAEAEKQSLLRRMGREGSSETIVGVDGGLKPVMERVELVGRSDVPVLILGETGSGKEVIARAIHNRSPRATGPFLRVNCGAIPPELIDSELFGHEKGSFTGATATRRGWFERAHEGTLFLDEIGELPPAAQVRLLRILQDGAFERVGGEESVKVDVRIIAATHRDLAAMVQSGRFREDLWYRVAVFPIVLPPLREHREDIPALAEHFARRASIRFGLTPQLPSREDLARLTAYPWPGNVRELAAVMDRAAILGEGERLEVAKALGVDVRSAVPMPASSGSVRASVPAAGILTIDEVMRNHIENALIATHGRVEGPFGAARLLGINPHTLRGRMRKLKVDWTRFRLVTEIARGGDERME
jgi:transcriptional regulator with GAF, ATPase, and Fis domain